MKRFLFHNLGWKILSLAIAIALWVTFASSPDMIMTIPASVVYQNMPPDLEMTSVLPEKVYLEVKGPSPRLRSVDPSAVSVTLNLENVNRPGLKTFTIDRSDTNLPPGISLQRAIPGELQLEFERRMFADVPVRVNCAGAPPSGYVVESQTATPDKLKIVGPASHVQHIGYAETDPVDLSTVVGTAEFRVHAFVGDPQVRLASPPEVTVRVSVAKAVVEEGAQPDGKKTLRD